MKYARVLLAHCPKQTTELFKLYYTGKYQPRAEINTQNKLEEHTTSTAQSLASILPLRYMTGSPSTQPQTSSTDATLASGDTAGDTPPEYEIPKPRTAFSAFVDHPGELIDFLETLVQQPDLKKEAKVDLFTTLFEMYLETAKGKKNATEKQEWEDKAKKLIEGKDVS